jgi:hypothetical protein
MGHRGRRGKKGLIVIREGDEPYQLAASFARVWQLDASTEARLTRKGTQLTARVASCRVVSCRVVSCRVVSCLCPPRNMLRGTAACLLATPTYVAVPHAASPQLLPAASLRLLNRRELFVPASLSEPPCCVFVGVCAVLVWDCRAVEMQMARLQQQQQQSNTDDPSSAPSSPR